MAGFDVYNDIKVRTNGEIYIGVVGPVRTGKSTFIKRFMEMMVIPNISDVNDKEMAMDEMPQSASGKMIMTTEPKFIPKDGININLDGDIDMKVRLIDCVGYVVDGAEGQTEDGKDRMVKTPWYDYEIPFAKAAEIGTKKVINNHSTVGVVVTCDGSFGDIDRENYIQAEERTVSELKKLGKPFVMILNTNRPRSRESMELVNSLSDKYGVAVLAVNCDELNMNDINEIFTSLLYSFPVTCINFVIPKWLEVADNNSGIKKSIINDTRDILNNNTYLYDIKNYSFPENEYVEGYSYSNVNLADGSLNVNINIYNTYYYMMMSDMLGADIKNEYDFITEIKSMAEDKKFCNSVKNALNSVKSGGYGLVMPDKEDIALETPELIKAGNKYGVKIKAEAPSVHMIKANITTEIAPIVGTKEQAEDLINYIKENTDNEYEDIWDVNIFGKSVEQLVEEGLSSKTNKMSPESKQKLQDTMEKIVNDGNGGLVCIII
jgi:stage IV sporulation protein A